MATTVLSTFNLNTKKQILDDQEDYSGVSYPSGASAIGVNYTVVSPSNTTIHNNTSTTDLDCYPLEDTEFGDIDLPTDAGGNVLQGVYQIIKKIYFVDGNGDVVYYWKDESWSVNLSFETPTAVATPEIDYYSPLLSVTDDTNYTVNSVTYDSITRSLKIIPPGDLGDPITTTGAYVSTATFYGEDGGLQYAFTLDSTLTYLFDGSSGYERYGVIVTIEDDEYRDIEVPAYVCQVFCVLSALERRYRASISCDERTLAPLRNKFVVASALAQLMRQAYLCGQVSKVTQYKDAILDLGHATDDCCCGGDDGPELVQGLGNTTGQNTVVIGGTGIAVTVDGNEYTVALDSETQDLLNALNYTVTSDDGSVTVVTSTEDGVTTFDLSVSSDVATSRLDVEVDCTFPLVVTPIFSISNQTLTGSDFQEVTQSAPDTFISLNTATNLTEYLNGELIVKLENFIAGDPFDYFVSCQIVKSVKSDAELTNIPVTAEIIDHDESSVKIRLRHSDGTMITGAWAGTNFGAPVQLKITFTS